MCYLNVITCSKIEIFKQVGSIEIGTSDTNQPASFQQSQFSPPPKRTLQGFKPAASFTPLIRHPRRVPHVHLPLISERMLFFHTSAGPRAHTDPLPPSQGQKRRPFCVCCKIVQSGNKRHERTSTPTPRVKTQCGPVIPGKWSFRTVGFREGRVRLIARTAAGTGKKFLGGLAMSLENSLDRCAECVR